MSGITTLLYISVYKTRDYFPATFPRHAKISGASAITINVIVVYSVSCKRSTENPPSPTSHFPKVAHFFKELLFMWAYLTLLSLSHHPKVAHLLKKLLSITTYLNSLSPSTVRRLLFSQKKLLHKAYLSSLSPPPPSEGNWVARLSISAYLSSLSPPPSTSKGCSFFESILSRGLN